jgi:outer membrane protein assembly factor BamB
VSFAVGKIVFSRLDGFLSALDAQTGKLVWKIWTVPDPGESGNDTWKGDSWQSS